MIRSWQQLAEHQEARLITTGDLSERQEKWLLTWLANNQQCAYGKTYRFNKIHSIADYQQLVPIVDYQDIEDKITAMADGQSNCLFAGTTVAFERTSGSTGKQKLIPYSLHSMADFQHAIVPWLAMLVETYQIESGKAYWAISPATRLPAHTPAGTPIGLPDAAYLGEELIPFFLETSAVPPWIAEISDMKDWQLATLYMLVCCQNLQLISVWSPTFLLSLLDALEERRVELSALLTDGGTIAGHPLSANVAGHKNLQRYYKNKNGTLLWPELKVISCWADASAKAYAQQIQARFPGVPLQPKGLLSTEAVVTVPNRHDQPVLAADSGFYELMDDQGKLWLAHELRDGESYRVIITTAGGLYRYRTRDRVRCDGYDEGLPILWFIGRELTSDLVGEKLSEEFVTTCLEDVPGFRMLIPVAGKKRGYRLIVEDGLELDPMLVKLEQRLCENPQYAYARKLGQLNPLQGISIKDPLAIYLASPIHANTRIGDIKVPSLCIKSNIFDAYLGDVA